MQDLNEMAIFAVVVGSGSFTKAAQKLKLPKSTVSRKVSQLERRIGVRLINRTTRNLKPTETGKIYYEHCVKMLDQAEEADRAVNKMQAEPSGRLRISTPLAFGTEFFVSTIKRFLDMYPKVSVEVISDNNIVDMLDEEIDIAFRVGPLSDSSLVARNLGTARFSLCASPNYLKQHGEPKSIANLDEHACLAHPDAAWVFKNAGEEVHYQPKSRLLANDMEMLKNSALAGMGIAALPQVLIMDELKEGRLERVLPDIAINERTLYLVYPSRREPPSKVVAFTEFMFDTKQPAPPWQHLGEVLKLNAAAKAADLASLKTSAAGS